MPSYFESCSPFITVETYLQAVAVAASLTSGYAVLADDVAPTRLEAPYGVRHLQPYNLRPNSLNPHCNPLRERSLTNFHQKKRIQGREGRERERESFTRNEFYMENLFFLPYSQIFLYQFISPCIVSSYSYSSSNHVNSFHSEIIVKQRRLFFHACRKLFMTIFPSSFRSTFLINRLRSIKNDVLSKRTH